MNRPHAFRDEQNKSPILDQQILAWKLTKHFRPTEEEADALRELVDICNTDPEHISISLEARPVTVLPQSCEEHGLQYIHIIGSAVCGCPNGCIVSYPSLVSSGFMANHILLNLSAVRFGSEPMTVEAWCASGCPFELSGEELDALRKLNAIADQPPAVQADAAYGQADLSVWQKFAIERDKSFNRHYYGNPDGLPQFRSKR